MIKTATKVDRHAGQAGSSYRFNRSSERAWEETLLATETQTICSQALQYVYNYNEPAPQKEDCLRAIAKVRANSSTICSPEYSSEAGSPPPVVNSWTSPPPLETEGTCNVTVQVGPGKCIARSQLADEATMLADACANLNRVTSGLRKIELFTDSSRRYNGISVSLSTE